MQLSELDRRRAVGDWTWMSWTAAGIAGIWTAVLLISLFAPDMVSGSQQEHLPLPALTTWLWGTIATGTLVASMGKLRGSAARQPIWIGLSVATLALWAAATICSIALPVVETGSDPTRMPVGALVAPVAAMVLGGLAGTTAGVFASPPRSD
jgi:hypothetical protein